MSLAFLLAWVCACEPRSVGDESDFAGACDGGATEGIWAMWPMPNPHVVGDLPNPSAYSVPGDGTVRDDVTCLVWQRQIAERAFTREEADRYCRALTLAGGKWRMPTRIELVSLLDFSKPAPGPMIDEAAFPDTPAQVFWSSSPTAGGEFFWYVNFYTGSTSNELPIMESRVRCVR